MKRLDPCPHCNGGRIIYGPDSDSVYSCLNCGPHEMEVLT